MEEILKLIEKHGAQYTLKLFIEACRLRASAPDYIETHNLMCPNENITQLEKLACDLQKTLNSL